LRLSNWQLAIGNWPKKQPQKQNQPARPKSKTKTLPLITRIDADREERLLVVGSWLLAKTKIETKQNRTADRADGRGFSPISGSCIYY
jgi:hypothetical protein